MTKSNIAIIILAAGKGTRMKSSLPKVLHSIGGRAMIDHVIDISLSLSNNLPIVVISNELSHFKSNLSEKACIAIQENQLGTGDAVKSALSFLPNDIDKVAVLYADTPLIKASTIEDMLTKLDDTNKVCVLGFNPDDPAEYGRLVVNDNGSLDSIVEYKDADDNQKQISLCNSGVIAVDGKLISSFINKIDNKNANNEYYLTDLVEIARNEDFNCSFVEAQEDEVLGVNNRMQLSEAEYIFQTRMRNKFMLSGVTMIDPKSVYFSYDTQICNDVVIEPNVFFGNKVVVESGVKIKAFSHIEGSIIGKNSVIGPFARLRPGTDLSGNNKIGNFVEIKNSEINEGSKINHLSYIGDAKVEKNVNIGAGTITCNYDGLNKHKTIIKEGAFIGSNSSIVAPVEVGSNSLIAAGSVVTDNVPNNNLAISRSRQVNKEKKGSN